MTTDNSRDQARFNVPVDRRDGPTPMSRNSSGAMQITISDAEEAQRLARYAQSQRPNDPNHGWRPKATIAGKQEVVIQGGKITSASSMLKTQDAMTHYAVQPTEPGFIEVPGFGKTSIAAAKAGGLLPQSWKEGDPNPFSAPAEAPARDKAKAGASDKAPEEQGAPEELTVAQHQAKIAGDILTKADQIIGAEATDAMLDDAVTSGNCQRMVFLPLMATPETFANRPEAMARFTATAEHYRTLKAQNPAYADALLDTQSRELLTLYDLARTSFDMTEADAMAYATAQTSLPEREKARRSLAPADADHIVRTALRSLDVSRADTQSAAVVARQVQTFAALNMTPEQITKNLQRWAEDSTVVVNGTLMVAERPLPPDFPDVAERFLGKVFAERGSALGIESAEDFFLQPVSGESKWQVWSKSLGVPVGNVYLDDEAIHAEREAVRSERDAYLAEKAAASDGQRDRASETLQNYYFMERDRIERMRRGGTRGNRAAADLAERDLEAFLRDFPSVNITAGAYQAWREQRR